MMRWVMWDPSSASGSRASRKRAVPETETTVASGDTSVGTGSDSRGVKRPAEKRRHATCFGG